MSILFPNTPIVFCGLNHFEPSTIKNRSLTTGVVESYSISDTLQTALTLHPQLNKVYYINDNTTTGQAIYKELEQVMFEYENQLEFAKLDGETFDLIVTTDDDAFQFVTQYAPSFIADTPVVFCGVNYLDCSILDEKNNITGVVEYTDLEGTLDLALSLHPNTERIIVINDTTLTGKNNLKRLKTVIPKYNNSIDFSFWSDVNMTEIQEMVTRLNKNDLIFLLTFNRDKSYNNYTYDESIELISKNAKVPIYRVWDFYMGKGLMGGSLISGYVQGQSAGTLVSEILNGTSPEEIAILDNNLTRHMFDYKELKKYNVKLSSLPKDSMVINRPFSLKALYNNDPKLFCIICFLLFFILVLFGLVTLLIRNIGMKKLSSKKARMYAMTDPLTGVYNRRACFDYLTQLVENSHERQPFSVAFVDADGLPLVIQRETC